MVIDLMAKYKLNTFQWHLTDNEGWRIEIKKYPKLTSVGGFHANTVLDGDRDGLDSISTGGYYTQEQIREVVKYAQNKFITIVPEIEMPAHSAAALRAYPELKCVLPANSPNIAANNIIYAPTDKTFGFLEDVLTEVVALFPGKYIHIGGDEANKTPWQESAFCQQLMKQLNIKDVHELQSYFIQRMEKYLNTKNRSIIGWDEILEGGLAQNATVMSWRGEKGGIAAAQQKHNVIMTPGPNGLYFDHYQSNSNFEPFNHEPGYHTYATLQKTYNYDPIPASLTDDEKKYIWGVQANIWSEHIATVNKLQYMILPRLFALSEIAWTLPKRKKGFNLFENDMIKQLSYFEHKGYNFRVPTAFTETDTVLIGGKFILQHNITLPGAKVYYTLNGHTPTENDKEYNTPLELLVPLNERRELQTTVITATGKRSVPTRTVMYNYRPFAANDGAHLSPGISYRIYPTDTKDTATVCNALATGILKDLRIDSLRRRFKSFRIVCEGYINVPADLTYTFSLSAKNLNKLFIDGHEIINDNTGFSRFENPGAAPLQKGYHKIRLEYFTEGNITEIPMYWQMEKDKRLKIQPEMLFH
jgi:hexosaminidase